MALFSAASPAERLRSAGSLAIKNWISVARDLWPMTRLAVTRDLWPEAYDLWPITCDP